MKRILSLVLTLISAAALCITPALADFSNPGIQQPEKPAKETEMMESPFVELRGTIISIEGNRVLIQSADSGNEVALNIDKNTAIIDNTAKKAVTLSALRVGETIYAWHSHAMSLSLPPQSYCYALIHNIAADSMAGRLFEVESVEKTKNGYRMLNTQQDLFFTVPADAKIPVVGGGRLKPSSIQPGTRLVLWYDVVLTSYPAQAGSDTLIALPYAYDGSVSANSGKASVNGREIPCLETQDGETFISLAAAAKKLGFRTTWNTNTETLTIRKGDMTAAFQAGNTTCNLLGYGEKIPAPILRDGVLYGDAGIFAFLGNYKVVTELIYG